METIPMLVVLGTITDAPATLINVIHDLNAAQIVERFSGKKSVNAEMNATATPPRFNARIKDKKVMKDSVKLETQLVIAGRDKRYTCGAVNPVIQRASSLVFDTVKDKNSPPPIAQTVSCFMVVAALIPTSRFRKR